MITNYFNGVFGKARIYPFSLPYSYMKKLFKRGHSGFAQNPSVAQKPTDLHKKSRDKKLVHFSDCSVYNEPAYPAGLCDCGAAIAHKRWWTYLYHLSRIRYAHLKSVVWSQLRILFGLPLSVSNPYQNPRFRPFDNNGLPLYPLDSNHKHEALPHDDDLDK